MRGWGWERWVGRERGRRERGGRETLKEIFSSFMENDNFLQYVKC